MRAIDAVCHDTRILAAAILMASRPMNEPRDLRAKYALADADTLIDMVCIEVEEVLPGPGVGKDPDSDMLVECLDAVDLIDLPGMPIGMLDGTIKDNEFFEEK